MIEIARNKFWDVKLGQKEWLLQNSAWMPHIVVALNDDTAFLEPLSPYVELLDDSKV